MSFQVTEPESLLPSASRRTSEFHSGCRMPDGAASFFLKAFPYRPPAENARSPAGSGRRCRRREETEAVPFHDEANFPDGRRHASRSRNYAPLPAAEGRSTRTVRSRIQRRIPSVRQTGAGQQVRKGQAGTNGFFHKYFTHHLNVQERMDWGKRRPSRTSSDP